ncbi:hypothetical protein CPLU01_09013 [Colletotrichum plurivorum]|uniref:CENP-V/GFA domain-containing protein n=1 Tax=Colletotrichum plurivorum TaxID=2175906 RepID=A0A8H6K9L0_9PEZI|nr:hypothetical protein CPLU01_09013 [Colletotrichum plurivorum]
MPNITGQCLCGNIKYTIAGKPLAAALCHCNDCRRISGSAFGYNWVVPTNIFSFRGEPKSYTTTANSGNPATSYFCGNCGVTLWREGTASPGLLYLKAGALDDRQEQASNQPAAELFTSRRLDWVAHIPGAHQKKEMNE